jgi:hypothetical protein
MARFYNEKFTIVSLRNDTKVVYLKDCLKLIDNSEYKEELVELYGFDLIKDKPLFISGLNIVMGRIIEYDNIFSKIDITTHVSSVNYAGLGFVDQNQILLRINNINNLNIEQDSIIVETRYNTKKDFFDGFYKMDKFANFCIRENLQNLIEQNIEVLNEKFSRSKAYIKSYRLLQDNEYDYFLRAITSINRYYDYNIRLSLFVSIVSLYKTIESTGVNYSINYCEFTESFIRIYFKKDIAKAIKNVGVINFSLEMNNDEIKREAFKFSGVFTISMVQEEREINIHIKPKKLKTPLLSVKHSCLPATLVENLSHLTVYISQIEEEMERDLIDISNITNVDHLRFFMLRKIENSRNEELKKYKKQIIETLTGKINHINQLLILMDKVNEIVLEFELKEYLRYLYYEILTNKFS